MSYKTYDKNKRNRILNSVLTLSNLVTQNERISSTQREAAQDEIIFSASKLIEASKFVEKKIKNGNLLPADFYRYNSIALGLTQAVNTHCNIIKKKYPNMIKIMD